MREIKKEELKNLVGGGVSAWIAFGLGTLFTFLAGVIDGYARPYKCN